MNKEITYELALALKNVGFPQDGYGECPLKESESVRMPNLESLIEACGDDFEELSWPANDEWFASAKTNEIKDCCKECGTRTVAPICEAGKTPTEAVANLYLALKKK